MRKVFLILLAAVGLQAAETNLVNLRTLDGKEFLKVRIVSTNKDGLVVKHPNKPGFNKVAFTNLPQTTVALYGPKQPETGKIELSPTEKLLLDFQVRLSELNRAELNNKTGTEYMNLALDIGHAQNEILQRGRLLSKYPEYTSKFVDKQLQEKLRDVEESKVWEDYKADRINSAQKAERMLAIEKKNRQIDQARYAEYQAAEVAQGKFVDQQVEQILRINDQLEVLKQRAHSGEEEFRKERQRKMDEVAEKYNLKQKALTDRN